MSFWDFTRSAASARVMVEFGHERGHSAVKLLEGSKLSIDQLKDPHAEIAAEQELRVVGNLLRLMKRAPWLGLEVGTRYRPQDYGYLGCGLLSSASVGDTLKLAVRFAPLTFSFARMQYREEGDLVVISYGETEVDDVLKQFLVERSMATAAALFVQLAGVDASLVHFTLMADYQWPRRSASTVPDIFGVKPQLGGRSNSLSFDRALLHCVPPQANPMMAHMCEQMCVQLMERRRVRMGTTAIVRQCLNVATESLTPNLASLARLTSTSERTLKRRLKDEGTSFRMLSMESRRRTAETLLKQRQLTMTEISEKLGFSSLSSFSQAFKRWSGMAPSEYRETWSE